MKRYLILFALLPLVAFSQVTVTNFTVGRVTRAAAPSYTTNLYVTNWTGAATVRNDFTSYVGYKFTIPSTIVVTDLARYSISGNAQTHTVRLLNANGGCVSMASASVDASQGSGAYVYTAITPVTITNGTYLVQSSETSGGDSWYDNDTFPEVTLGTVVGSAYGDDCANNGSSANAYAVPSFKYYVP